MPLSIEDINKVLGNLALLEDGHPTHLRGTNKAADLEEIIAVWRDSPESAEGRQNLEEVLWMMATYCFDVSKRFGILHEAVGKLCRERQVNPDPDLLDDVERDRRAINGTPEASNCVKSVAWKSRAHTAGDQLLHWHIRSHRSQQQFVRDSLDRFTQLNANRLDALAAEYRQLVGAVPAELLDKLPPERRDAFR